MAELAVIYDPALEVAAIINLDEQRAFGPAMVGPEAGEVLQAFIDATPFDLSELGTIEACLAFGSFLDRMVNPAEVAPDQADNGQVVTSPSADVGGGDALAQAEAAGASDVPPPPPADTDEVSDTPTKTVTAPCFNCDGSGMVEFGDGSPAQRCGMCGGTGKIKQEVPA